MADSELVPIKPAWDAGGADLTGYRPQTAPFTMTIAPNSQEEAPGVGIRRNNDVDDFEPVYRKSDRYPAIQRQDARPVPSTHPADMPRFHLAEDRTQGFSVA